MEGHKKKHNKYFKYETKQKQNMNKSTKNKNEIKQRNISKQKHKKTQTPEQLKNNFNKIKASETK